MSPNASPSSPPPAAVRARDLGVPFDGRPGPLNAITDVAGIEVGLAQRIDDAGARCGVTAVFPRGRGAAAGVPAGLFAFNGTGELTASHQIREIGAFFGPVLLTGTTSVGCASQAALRWMARHTLDDDARFARVLPVVGETWDGNLNDAWGFHLREDDVFAALDGARNGPVAEGNAGGGTGMVCHGFKGGTGTASREFELGDGRFRLGALVQANHGRRDELMVAGVPAGRLIQGFEPEPPAAALVDGSLIGLLATDLPLTPLQLQRVARRAALGMARLGAHGGALSGDIFLAFSTASPVRLGEAARSLPDGPSDDVLDPVFQAAVQAVEEAIVNALVAAQTMRSRQGLLIHALPHAQLAALMQRRRMAFDA
jgi:L-aminopeptidase/D-esterase-like protein